MNSTWNRACRRGGGAMAACALLAGLAGMADGAQAPAPPPTLAAVGAAIDQAAARIHGLTADARVLSYTRAVDDQSVQTGTLAAQLAKNGKTGPMFVLQIAQPASETYLYKEPFFYDYRPAIRQVQRFDLSAHRDVVNQYVLLGLGSAFGQMSQAYAITLVGAETVGGASTVHLILAPRDPLVVRTIVQADLWYDTTLWVAIQQKFVQPSGDYRLLDYSNVRINPSIPAMRFDTRFNGAPVVVMH